MNQTIDTVNQLNVESLTLGRSVVVVVIHFLKKKLILYKSFLLISCIILYSTYKKKEKKRPMFNTHLKASLILIC